MLVLALGCSDALYVGASSRPPLALAVTEPAYGAFVGDGPIVVAGRVTNPEASVYVEGREVNVGTDGTFEVELPVEGDWRVVDVEAVAPGAHLRERLPVFAGEDPMATFPGGLGVRLTPTGLQHLAEVVQGMLVDLDIPGTLGAALPSIELGDVALLPVGVTALAPVATLVPDADGIALGIALDELAVDYTVETPWTGAFGVTVGIDRVGIGGRAVPATSTDGALVLGIEGLTVELADPILVFGGASSPWLESLIGDGLGFLGDTVALLLEGVVSLISPLRLFGPLSFDTDLLGAPLAISLDRVWSDASGLGVALGVDLGTGPGEVPVADAATAGVAADLAVTLHEGLFQALLASELLALLEQDLELAGVFGEVLALPLASLPGGSDLPDDRTGFCLSIEPGEARLVRLQDGLSPMATLVLPDVKVKIEVSTEDDHCGDWLEASLAIEADLRLTGSTTLGADIRIADGAVVSYAAADGWTEDAVITGLQSLIGVLTSLLGGSLEIDLADAIGGVSSGDLGAVDLRLLDQQPVPGHPGTYLLTLSLWD